MQQALQPKKSPNLQPESPELKVSNGAPDYITFNRARDPKTGKREGFTIPPTQFQLTGHLSNYVDPRNTEAKLKPADVLIFERAPLGPSSPEPRTERTPPPLPTTSKSPTLHRGNTVESVQIALSE